ncbi:YtcA family lipoprotein [Alcaligenes endophyticus]|uniref:Uncharacterized protein YtcA n=1 Tax=Alcaligenes endophyticus TaxID=1929088 RepID=A0ABT8ELY8_9BURK|nr:YtcA family lipoprotein [Alcaligenes endophyticus]MCX5591106.1 YtcA family lipoprotein [Alcaligenes endophyticus]MDN4122316.1 hypothetical protein [Alcaligenes endophyticus]
MRRSPFLLLPLVILLAGCQRYAPSVYIAGSYFPAWLICAVVGIFGALLLRVVAIKIGLEDILPARLLVYVCLALIIAMLFAYFGFTY